MAVHRPPVHLCIPPLVLGGFLIGAAVPAPFKCGGVPNTMPGFEPDDPVVVVDDAVLSAADGVKVVERVDVATLVVECWDPETGEIGKDVVGITVVRVVTKTAWRDLVEPALEVIRAQAAAHRETGGYRSSVVDVVSARPDGVLLHLESDGSSWRLTLESRFHRCVVSDRLRADATREALARDTCTLRPEEQAAALRRAYDG